MPIISLVIPCYGSAATLETVVEQARAALGGAAGYGYEIILVSDASPDGVFEVIRRLAAKYPDTVRGMELARNFGQHAALMAGYRHCRGDIIVSMDDDGQTPAGEVMRLVDKLQEGCDVVYAEYPRVRQPLYRRLGSRLNKAMMERMLGKPREITANSYFACRRYVVDEMLRYTHPFPYVGGLVFRTTRHIASVPVPQQPRLGGRSGYTLGKLVSLWVNGFTAFSVKPLRIATAVGSALAVGGFVYAIWLVVNKLVNPATPLGYSSAMCALLFIGGMLMLMLGLVGEYVGRVYISINNAPQYVVRSAVNLENSAAETPAPGGAES